MWKLFFTQLCVESTIPGSPDWILILCSCRAYIRVGALWVLLIPCIARPSHLIAQGRYSDMRGVCGYDIYSSDSRTLRWKPQGYARVLIFWPTPFSQFSWFGSSSSLFAVCFCLYVCIIWAQNFSISTILAGELSVNISHYLYVPFVMNFMDSC